MEFTELKCEDANLDHLQASLCAIAASAQVASGNGIQKQVRCARRLYLDSPYFRCGVKDFAFKVDMGDGTVESVKVGLSLSSRFSKVIRAAFENHTITTQRPFYLVDNAALKTLAIVRAWLTDALLPCTPGLFSTAGIPSIENHTETTTQSLHSAALDYTCLLIFARDYEMDELMIDIKSVMRCMTPLAMAYFIPHINRLQSELGNDTHVLDIIARELISGVKLDSWQVELGKVNNAFLVKLLIMKSA